MKTVENTSEITVTIVVMCSDPKTVTLPEESTVADAFRAADININGLDVYCEGIAGTPNAEVEDKDVLTAVKNKVESGII